MKFKLIREDVNSFERIVNVFLNDGWFLHGNTFVYPSSGYLYQALYKP